MISKYLDDSTVKSDKTKPLNRFFFRPISLLITPFFVWLRMSPNWISFLRMFIALGAMILLFSESLEIRILGLCVYTFAKVLDFVDGNIARVFKSKTFFGKWLDGLVDIVSAVAILIAVASYSDFGLSGGFGCAFAVCLSYYIVIRYNGILQSAKLDNGKPGRPATLNELYKLSYENLNKTGKFYISSFLFWRIKQLSEFPLQLYSKMSYLLIVVMIIISQEYYLSWIMMVWTLIMLISTFFGAINNALGYLYVSRD